MDGEDYIGRFLLLGNHGRGLRTAANGGGASPERLAGA